MKRFSKLIILLLLVGLLAGCQKKKNPVTGPEDNSPELTVLASAEEAYQLIQSHQDDPNFVILDVRSDAEFRDGHIPSAINININSETFRDDVDGLDKNKTYLVYCRSGSRSTAAVEIMQELGFLHLYNFTGGFSAWQGADYPIDKES